MFKKFYNAGHNFAEKTLPSWVKKFPGSKKTDEDAKDVSGMIGIAAGGVLEKLGYIGMAVTLLGAAAAGFTGGLSLIGLIAFGAVGTGFAMAGTFGKGMEDGGDKNTGLLTLGNQIQSPLVSIISEKFQNWRHPKASCDFATCAAKDAAAPETAKAAPATADVSVTAAPVAISVTGAPVAPAQKNAP